MSGWFKAVRDAIAALLGIDDGSSRLTWVYQQEKPVVNAVRGREKADYPCYPRNLQADGTGIRVKVEVTKCF